LGDLWKMGSGAVREGVSGSTACVISIEVSVLEYVDAMRFEMPMMEVIGK